MQQSFSLNPEDHTILAVDDKPLNLRLLRQMLEQEDFNVIEAEDGRAALELLTTRDDLPDMILLDINMPVMNGLETCRKLQADPKTQSIPIIFVSGVSELEDKIAAFQEGAVDFISKPFQVDEVIARVSTHLTLRNLRRTLEKQIIELERTQQELEASNRELARLSVQDSLTSLYNRRYLDENLRSVYSRARRYGKSLSLMVCDIDNFKQVNDTFSHEVGDNVIQAVADMLQNSVRDADIVARYGGEEFVVVFPETLVNNAAIVCERIRKQVEQYPWHDVSNGLAVTLSMGLSGNITFESHEKMLADADKKMYEAKVGGKNQLSW
ncbi:MAG: diguanylate cyclase [Deinococcota bacterium]